MTSDQAGTEEARVAGLVAAQEKAVALFGEVEARGLVAPGVGEREASDRIRELANDLFGTTKHWHKRIIRSGPNTMRPYRDNPRRTDARLRRFLRAVARPCLRRHRSRHGACAGHDRAAEKERRSLECPLPKRS